MQSNTSENITPEPAHHPFGPSGLEMLARCPGFLNSGETNKQAERGTKIHKALEKGDWSKLDNDKEKPIAQDCQDFLDALLEENRPALPDPHLREIRLNIDLGGEITTFGTCDALLIYGNRGEMLDFKTGYLQVSDAEFNPQSQAYVLGAFQRYPQLETINFHFLIPVRDEHSLHTFRRDDIPNIQFALQAIILRAKAADPSQFSPESELCCYCARAGTCPALALKTRALASKIRPEIVLPESILVDPTRPEEIAQLLRLAPLVEEWAKGVRAAALKANLEEGVEIPGFRRIESTTPRSVTSVLGAWQAIKEDSGITLENFLSACGTISLPQLEEAVAALAKRGEKGKAKEALMDSLRFGDVLRDGSSYFYIRESKK